MGKRRTTNHERRTRGDAEEEEDHEMHEIHE